jgi:hypothetical protein
LAGLRCVVTDNGRDAFLPRHDAERVEIWLHDDVGEASIGATDGEAGNQLLSDVPAKDDIALGESAAAAAFNELLGEHAFAAIDAVHIGAADLDDADLAIANVLLDLGYVHHCAS